MKFAAGMALLTACAGLSACDDANRPGPVGEKPPVVVDPNSPISPEAQQNLRETGRDIGRGINNAAEETQDALRHADEVARQGIRAAGDATHQVVEGIREGLNSSPER